MQRIKATIGRLGAIGILSAASAAAASPVAVIRVPDYTATGHMLETSANRVDGSESYDSSGSIVAWQWDFDDDGAYDDATGARPWRWVSFPDQGTYSIGLRVTSANGETATASAQIVVSNAIPELQSTNLDYREHPITGANMYTNEQATLAADFDFVDATGDTITVTADYGDGSPPELCPAQVTWESPFGKGTRAECRHPYASPIGSIHTVSFTACDDDGGCLPIAPLKVGVQSIWDPVLQLAHQTFATNEGAPISMELFSYPAFTYWTVTLPGHGTVDGFPISFYPEMCTDCSECNCEAFPDHPTSYGGPGGPQVLYTPESGFVGTDSFTYMQLVATSEGDQTWLSVLVTVDVLAADSPPVADAGAGQTKNEGSPVMLDATGSSDPDGDAITFSWIQIAGPAVALAGADTAIPAFVAPLVDAGGALLTFQLTVSDATGKQASTIVEVLIQNVNDPPSCAQATASLAKLWPPNHQLVRVTIGNISDAVNDPVTVSVTGVTQDEPLDAAGDGETAPDAELDAGGAVSLRAERAGVGNGRVYAIAFSAVDSFGESCSGTVTVGVPHSFKSTPVDDGQVFDSLAP